MELDFRLVGLTGGIAAGKSSASSYFAQRGIPIIDADLLAREVVAPGTEGLLELVAAFGETILNPDGSLHRACLADIVFDDPDRRRQMEQIIHPRIALQTQQHLSAIRTSRAPIAIYDAPLLFEAGAHVLCHLTLVVSTSPETQKARVIARDGLNAAAAQARIDSQMPLAEKVKLADVVIDNSSSLSAFEAKLSHFLEDLAPRLWPDTEDATTHLSKWLKEKAP